jgi:hypothetical protein
MTLNNKNTSLFLLTIYCKINVSSLIVLLFLIMCVFNDLHCLDVLLAQTDAQDPNVCLAPHLVQLF